MFVQYDPSVIGNDYLIVGTVEKTAWREGLSQPKSVTDMLPQTHDFKSYQEMRMTMGAGSAPIRSHRLCLLLHQQSGLNAGNRRIHQTFTT